MANQLPWSKFYWADWRKDPDLCRCSKAAKGFWIDLLAIAYECENPGVLSTNGKPWSDDDIAKSVGGDCLENASLLLELLDKGVASRDDSGAVTCRRMMRDEQERRDISEKRAIAGSKGGSKRTSKTEAKRKQSLSDSDSTSDSSKRGDARGDTHNGKITQSQAEAIYGLYPRKVGKRDAIRSIASAHARLLASGDTDPIATLTRQTAAYAASPSGQPPPAGGNDYRPHPSTWFNQARYEDDPNEWQKPNGVDSKSRAADDNISRVRAPAGKYADIDSRA